MITSIATVSIAGTLGDKLQAIAAAGFDGVEIFENDLIVSALSPETVREICADLGLRITVYQPFRDFEGLAGIDRDRAFERAERKFDLMERLGTSLLLVCSSLRADASGDFSRIADDLRELGERAAHRGLRIAYEGLAWGAHVRDHRDVAAVVAEADHPAVGMVLDSFHSLSLGIAPQTLHAIDPAKIFLVQLADAPRLSMDVLQWSRHFRCMPLQGDLALTPYVAALQEIAYAGPLSLEIFNDRFRSGSPGALAVDGLRSLVAVQDSARRARGAGSSLPPRQSARPIRFIELAASPEEGARLGAMLRTLGFRLSGRHRSLALTRWTQGETNLVINTDSGSFAGSFDVVHGASICALGVEVASVATTLRRAQALAIPRFDDEGELARLGIPALRGIGGSLIYLLDPERARTVWDEQFAPMEDTAATEPAHLATIDHAGAIVLPSEGLSWRLFWTSLFAMSATPEADLADPAGLVHSQAVQGDDGAHRITLNSTGGPSTLSSRFVQTGFGTGFQHLALKTDDIFATAAALNRNGADILPIPDNYYDDLLARTALGADAVERLRAAQILYDEDADGNRFHQIFTSAFDKRFFFEIVQRDPGYQGYGAANAATRLSAQSGYIERPDYG